MSQLLMNKLRGLAGAAALLVVFLVMGSVDASAQTRASSVENNQSALAQNLGVTACPMGSATNVQGGLASLETWSQSMKTNLSSATLLDKAKYAYYQRIITDVRDYSIAPELALIENLKAAKGISNGGITVQQMAAMYNATKVLFGMCQ